MTHMPGLIGRWDHGTKVRAELKHMKRPPSAYLRRFTYDTIGHDDRINRNLVALVGADHTFPSRTEYRTEAAL